MFGVFCDPLTSIYKAVQQPHIYTAISFLPQYSAVNLFIFISGSLLWAYSVLRSFCILQESLQNKIVSSISKTELIFPRLSIISRFLNIWSWLKFSQFRVPLPKYKAECMHASWATCVWWPGVVCSSIKMQNASECVVMHASLESVLTGLRQDSHLLRNISGVLNSLIENYSSCRSIEEESKIHIKNKISCLFLHIWIVGLTWY